VPALSQCPTARPVNTTSQLENTLTDEHYSDEDEALDLLLRVRGVLAHSLERRAPQWLRAELRQTLAQVDGQILGATLEWIH